MTKTSVKIGDIFTTKTNGNCSVVEYVNARHVLVLFEEHPCVVKCTVGDLRLGKVRNPMRPSVYNKGYLGVGKYDGTHKDVYSIWVTMLGRCYSMVNPRVKINDSFVCDEWLNFQNFAEWCYKQSFFGFKDEKGKTYHLDKDILVNGNRVYSPNTCCFVPNEINILFRRLKPKPLPEGVSFSKTNSKLQSQIKIGNKTISLGFYDNVEDAEMAYKNAKKIKFKNIAEVWKDKIPVEVYARLITHET